MPGSPPWDKCRGRDRGSRYSRTHSTPGAGAAPWLITTAFPPMTTTCLAAWALALLLVPVFLFAWILETDRDRARRFRRSGLSQQRIADRLGCSRWRVRQLLA